MPFCLPVPGQIRGKVGLVSEGLYERVMRQLDPDRLPTAEQRRVIESTESAILVVAGAGSGKTATMANRIAYQVASGRVSPEEVLGLTFTRKAAGELSERVDRALAGLRAGGLLNRSEQSARSALARPTVSTYNAFAADIAASYGMLVGADPTARLITDAERFQLMDAVIAEGAIASDVAARYGRARIVEVALALASGAIDNRVPLEAVRDFLDEQAAALERLGADPRKFTKADMADVGMEAAQWERLKRDWQTLKKVDFALQRACLPAVEAYAERKRALGLVEFADQVATASRVLERYPQIGEETASRYRLVLLDEYQDTSVNQAHFLRRALGGAGDGRSVCAVGDPNQAIYGWRGASSNALADFARSFAGAQPVERLALSTSFRSDAAILDAANAVAAPLDSPAVEVRELQPRPGCGPGRVVEARPLLAEDSYRAIARRIEDVRARTSQAEIAVLCRRRSSIEKVADALGHRGISYEIVGGESLIERPEILTVRAALGILAHPSRGGLLVRLLLHWGIGSDAIRILYEWSRSLASRAVGKTPLDPRAEANLVEALDDLPDPGWSGPSGLVLTPAVVDRLRLVSQALASLRASIHLPLADIVERSISVLGIDLAAASRAEGSQRVRTSLDSFIALGREYAMGHPGASLGDFVDWLDLVERHEYGGEEESGVEASEDVEVHAGVVQIMTMHAAKGLEWRDLVAIPEVVATQFSETNSAASWLTDPSVFPFPLRADYRHLPQFEPSAFANKLEAALAYNEFLRTDLPAHESAEARRLAYVAFTRPQSELFLAGYGLASPEIPPKAVDGDAVHLIGPSAFLEDIRREAKVVPVREIADSHWPTELTEQCADTMPLAAVTERIGGPPEPVIDYASADLPLWPADIVRHDASSRKGGMRDEGALSEKDAERTFGALESSSGTNADAAKPSGMNSGAELSGTNMGAKPSGTIMDAERLSMWCRNADLLIRERELALRPSILQRPYVTATDVVHLSDDPSAFLAQWRRPIPQRPSRAARTGTELHSRIAEFYQRPAMLDIDSVMAEGQHPVDMDPLTREEERRLLDAFKASRWARMTPLAIEESLSVVVGGRVVRCTIDAVLDTSAEPDLPAVTIVDWKTGRRPSRQALASRELQLAIYRLAWARTHSRDIAEIGACFVYLREPEEKRVLVAGNLTEDEVARRIEASLAAGGSDRA